ncbi:glycosyltransferase [Actinomyces culturomici]|uniref:glycosyltransferase n=1 Tax=Actinomyces culturomici TaxID=1926276 RepID=UPI000E2084AF|nr:glycosyltransferase [Actinomyces culturomici]
MRVCFVPSWYPRPSAPFNGTFFREQARMLADAGHDVSVLSAEPVRAESRDWIVRPRLAIEDGLRVVRVDLPTLPRGARLLEERLHRSLLARAARLLEHEVGTPHVVHGHTVFPGGTSAAFLAERWGAPLVLTEHRPSSISAPAFLSRRRRIDAAVGRASLLTTVSSGFASALDARYPRTSWVAIPLPVPDLFFEARRVDREPSAPIRFLHVSHIDDNKRVVETCRAFADAFPEGGARLTVIGGTPESIERVRGGLGGEIPAHVEFVGRKPRSEIAAAMAASDVFILVSAVETGGAVFSEAQAAGVRILASATWGGRFAVRDGLGELVPVDDHDALVDAMRRLANDEGYLAPADIRARARERYSESSFTDRWTALYREVTDEADDPSRRAHRERRRPA